MNTENKNDHCKNLPLHYIEQIALNKAGITCLDGRVGRVETDIRERYTKDEVNCMLAGKADRCALEKHLIDPCAHRAGYQTGGCGKSSMCDCDCYTKEEINALLANKCMSEKRSISFKEGYKDWGESYFSHLNCGLLIVKISAGMEIEADLPANSAVTLATLPEGYRPADMEKITAVQNSTAGISLPQAGQLMLSTNGDIIAHITAAGVKAIFGTIVCLFAIEQA